MAKRIGKSFIGIIIIAIIMAGGFIYWQYQNLHPSTDDAYIQANVIHVAAQVSGPVSKIYVIDHQHVKPNQPLFDIDPTPFRINVAKAKAELLNTIQSIQAAQEAINTNKALVKERQAELVVAKKNAKRINTLLKQKLTSQASADETNEKLNVALAALDAASNQLQEAKEKLGAKGEANAQIRSARATLAQAELDLSYTHVTAQASGHLVNFKLRVGSMVEAGQSEFTIIEDHPWWVEANFKETKLKRVHPGQLATIKVDMYPDHLFKGTVQSISSGSGTSFSLLPPENATGNWVKVTQRFPIKIMITELNSRFPLRMGASATVTIDTTRSIRK